MNFWTGGRKNFSCLEKWGWCSSGVELPPDLKWAKAQPDNKGGAEHCLHLHINRTGITFSDRNCTNRFVYACKVLLLFIYGSMRRVQQSNYFPASGCAGQRTAAGGVLGSQVSKRCVRHKCMQVSI